MKPEIVDKVPALYEHCGRLLALSDAMLVGRLEAARTDHVAFMLITFAVKQALHSRSMGALATAGCYADMATIARTMLDGYTLLKWSLREPAERSLAWRSYSLVMDYNLMQQKRASGESIDEAQERALLIRLDEHGQRFLRKTTPHGARQYHSRWHIGDDGRLVTLLDMMSEIGSAQLYEFYDQWSSWSHWNPRGIGTGMQETESGFAFRWDQEESAVAPLAVGFQCLLETLEALDGHLSLGFSDKLAELRVNFVREMNRGPQAA